MKRFLVGLGLLIGFGFTCQLLGLAIETMVMNEYLDWLIPPALWGFMVMGMLALVIQLIYTTRKLIREVFYARDISL
jgi:ABC-type antimicrobial peptide transport system permease subunit